MSRSHSHSTPASTPEDAPSRGYWRTSRCQSTTRAAAQPFFVLNSQFSILNSAPRAFTLVEVLLALALTGTTLALAARIALNVLKARQAVTGTLDRQRRLDHVADCIAADLDGQLTDIDDSVVIRLDANHRPLIEIVGLAAEPGHSLHTSRLPATVTYRLVRAPHEDLRLKLEREVQPLAGRSSVPWSTTVCNDLAGFEVELHDGQQWLPLTARTLKQVPEPRGFRIAYHRAEDDTELTRTFVLGSVKHGDDQR